MPRITARHGRITNGSRAWTIPEIAVKALNINDSGSSITPMAMSRRLAKPSRPYSTWNE